MPETSILLDGTKLDLDAVWACSQGAHVVLDDAGLARMAKTNAHIQAAANTGKPVYGVTTGLGPNVTQKLDAATINSFSRTTILGRAQALGTPLPMHVVRSAMSIRINTLLTGASGAHPRIAQHLAACLNAGLIPKIREFGSVGAADLLWGGALAQAMIGEGQFLDRPKTESAAESIVASGIAPLELGPRDGLALVSHSSFSNALAALGLKSAQIALANAQTIAALTIEGFRANLTPINADVLALRPAAGEAECGDDLRAKLAGSKLFEPGHARRLQDPLSIRNIVQIHGATHAAIANLEATLKGELNGASDNPVVLEDTGEILSSGAYLNPNLTVGLVALNHAFVHTASAILARCMKMLFERFTNLPNGLAGKNGGAAGFAPVSKAAEVLLAEIQHQSNPPLIYPSVTADGVEDVVTHSAIAGKSLNEITNRLSYLLAFEALLAVHAIRLRGDADTIAPGLRPIFETIAALSLPLEQDRSFTGEIENLAEKIRENARL